MLNLLKALPGLGRNINFWHDDWSVLGLLAQKVKEISEPKFLLEVILIWWEWGQVNFNVGSCSYYSDMFPFLLPKVWN